MNIDTRSISMNGTSNVTANINQSTAIEAGIIEHAKAAGHISCSVIIQENGLEPLIVTTRTGPILIQGIGQQLDCMA